MAADGLITIPSAFGPEETMNRLKAEVRAKGMTVFAHVDQAAGAAAAEVASADRSHSFPCRCERWHAAYGFSGPDNRDRSSAEALVWQDAAGATWLSHNDPRWLAERHAVNPKPTAVLNAV